MIRRLSALLILTFAGCGGNALVSPSLIDPVVDGASPISSVDTDDGGPWLPLDAGPHADDAASDDSGSPLDAAPDAPVIPVIVAVGDSETAGTRIGGPGNTYTDSGTMLLPIGTETINLGLSGQRLLPPDFLNSTEPTTGGPNDAGYTIAAVQVALTALHAAHPDRPAVVTVWLGTNDLGSCDAGNQPACGGIEPKLQAGMTTVLQTIRAMTPTPKLVAFTLSCRTGYLGGTDENSAAAFDADQKAFNTWLRSQRGTLYDELVDLGADPYLGDAATCASTTYFLDGLHQTTLANYRVIAPLWAKAVESAIRE